VIWFYERSSQRIRIETTKDPASGTFGLTIDEGDGKLHVETFTSEGAFERRLKMLEFELLSDHWTPSGTALI
jgi:hypothetical protein